MTPLQIAGNLVGALASAALLFAIARPLYLDWTSERAVSARAAERAATEQKDREVAQQQVLSSIGYQASVTAGFVLSASRLCRIIGKPNLKECSAQRGPLPEEKSAAELASMALGEHERFIELCLKQIAKDKCDSLLQRAVDIAWRKDAPAR